MFLLLILLRLSFCFLHEGNIFKVVLVFSYDEDLNHVGKELNGTIAGLIGFNLFEGINLVLFKYYLNANRDAAGVELRAKEVMYQLDLGGYDAVALFDDSAMQFVGIPYYDRFTTPVFFSEMNGTPEYYNETIFILKDRNRPGGNWTGVMCEMNLFHTLDLFSNFYDIRNTFVPLIFDNTTTARVTYRSMSEEILKEENDAFLKKNNIKLEYFIDIEQYDTYKDVIRKYVEDNDDVKVYFPYAFHLYEGDREVQQKEIQQWTIEHVRKAAEITWQGPCDDGYFGGAQPDTFQMTQMMGQQIGNYLVEGGVVAEMPIATPTNSIYFNIDRVNEIELKRLDLAEALIKNAEAYGYLYHNDKELTAAEMTGIVLASLISLGTLACSLICCVCFLCVCCFSILFAFISYTVGNACVGAIFGCGCIGVCCGCCEAIWCFYDELNEKKRDNKILQEANDKKEEELKKRDQNLRDLGRAFGVQNVDVFLRYFIEGIGGIKGFDISKISPIETDFTKLCFDEKLHIYSRNDPGDRPHCDLYTLKGSKEKPGELLRSIKNSHLHLSDKKESDFVVKWFKNVSVEDDMATDEVGSEITTVKGYNVREYLVEIVALAIDEKKNDENIMERELREEEGRKIADIAIIMEKGKGDSLEKYLGTWDEGRYYPPEPSKPNVPPKPVIPDSLELKIRILIRVCKIMLFLHDEQKVMHLDLKADNLLLMDAVKWENGKCEFPELKMIDFGGCKKIDSNKKKNMKKEKSRSKKNEEEHEGEEPSEEEEEIIIMKSESEEELKKKKKEEEESVEKWDLGTPGYCTCVKRGDPIRVVKAEPISEKCDVFSFGVLVYALLFAINPTVNASQVWNQRKDDLELTKKGRIQVDGSEKKVHPFSLRYEKRQKEIFKSVNYYDEGVLLDLGKLSCDCNFPPEHAEKRIGFKEIHEWLKNMLVRVRRTKIEKLDPKAKRRKRKSSENLKERLLNTPLKENPDLPFEGENKFL